MRLLGLCAALFAAILPAAAGAVGDERRTWEEYDAPAFLDTAPAKGIALRAGIADNWNFQKGMVSLVVPEDPAEPATLEFRLPLEALRPNRLFSVELGPELRASLGAQLAAFASAPETDNSGDPDQAICIDYWGAQLEIAVDGKWLRELPSAACYQNEAFFDFVIGLTDIVAAQSPLCRSMTSDETTSLFRLRECALLDGDRELAGRHFGAIEEIHRIWPSADYLTPETRVSWDRRGLDRRKDYEEYEDGFQYHYLDLRAELTGIGGLPMGEVEVRARYHEELRDREYVWDAREIWSFGADGKPVLVSLTATRHRRAD